MRGRRPRRSGTGTNVASWRDRPPAPVRASPDRVTSSLPCSTPRPLTVNRYQASRSRLRERSEIERKTAADLHPSAGTAKTSRPPAPASPRWRSNAIDEGPSGDGEASAMQRPAASPISRSERSNGVGNAATSGAPMIRVIGGSSGSSGPIGWRSTVMTFELGMLVPEGDCNGDACAATERIEGVARASPSAAAGTSDSLSPTPGSRPSGPMVAASIPAMTAVATTTISAIAARRPRRGPEPELAGSGRARGAIDVTRTAGPELVSGGGRAGKGRGRTVGRDDERPRTRSQPRATPLLQARSAGARAIPAVLAAGDAEWTSAGMRMVTRSGGRTGTGSATATAATGIAARAGADSALSAAAAPRGMCWSAHHSAGALQASCLHR